MIEKLKSAGLGWREEEASIATEKLGFHHLFITF